VQASCKHASGNECLKRLRRGCRRASKLHSNGSRSDEKSPQIRCAGRRTMTVGLASKTPRRNRPEIGGKGGVVLQANCKQWIQERPGSVRNAAEARNTKSQLRGCFFRVAPLQDTRNTTQSGCSSPPFDTKMHLRRSQRYEPLNVGRGTACLQVALSL
jgi:hypothetical protein